MKTNMKLFQDFDKVFIQNHEPFQLMIIDFSGSFDGDMVSTGNVIINKNKIILLSVEPDVTGVLFAYNGNLNITKAFAYIDNKKNYIVTMKESDNVNTIKSKWNESTSKYTDFYRTNKRKPYKQTILRKKA